jgi:hypothetical protein
MLRFFSDCSHKCCPCCRHQEDPAYIELQRQEAEERDKEVLRLKEEEEAINVQEDELMKEAQRIQKKLEHVQLQRFMFVHENIEAIRRYVIPGSSISEASSSNYKGKGKEKDKSPKGSPKGSPTSSPRRNSHKR